MRSKSSDTAANSARVAVAQGGGEPGSKADAWPLDDRLELTQPGRARTVPELGGGLQTHHLRRELPVGSGRFGRRQQDCDRLADGALASGHPRPGEAPLIVQRPKWMSQLVERGKRGGGLVGRTAHGERDRAWEVASVPPADGIARGGQRIGRLFQQRTCGIKAAGAKCGPTRHRGTEQLRRPREIGCLLAHPLGHLNGVR